MSVELDLNVQKSVQTFSLFIAEKEFLLAVCRLEV